MSIDITGKLSLVVIYVSEVFEKLGWVVNVDFVQIIAAVGAIVMIADKLIRLKWMRKDRIKAEKRQDLLDNR